MSHAPANLLNASPLLGHSLKDKLATRVADGSADPEPDPDPSPEPPQNTLFLARSEPETQSRAAAAVHDLLAEPGLRSLIDVFGELSNCPEID